MLNPDKRTDEGLTAYTYTVTIHARSPAFLLVYIFGTLVNVDTGLLVGIERLVHLRCNHHAAQVRPVACT